MTELQIIGAGLGRTGTLSIREALEILGFGPCHHMKVVVMEQPERGYLWKGVSEGDTEKLKDIFKGFKSAVDYPGCVFYEQFMEWNPDAKVLLSIRDSPQAWETSCRATIFKPGQGMGILAMLPFGSFRFHKYIMKMINRIHGKDPEDPDTDLQALYEEWNKGVIEKVPSDKLLVFNVKQGWEPLCKFLGVPVPNVPFPRVNDTKQFQKRLKMMDYAGKFVVVLAVSVVAGIVAGLVRYFM